MPRSLCCFALALWFPLCAAAADPPTPAPQDCASCHTAAKKPAGIHAGIACTDCHAGRERVPHPDTGKTLGCAQCHSRQSSEHAVGVHGQALRRGNPAAPTCDTCHGNAHETRLAESAAFRAAIPDTCGMCHSDIAAQFRTSVHAAALRRGFLQAPVCTDCHGEHSIQRAKAPSSFVHPSHIRETCAPCHANVRLSRKFGFPSDRLLSYDTSFHGLAAKAGAQSVANCASCHGVHNILPSSDPKSTINAKNLPATCGNCHHGAGARFALGPVHLWPGRTEPASVRWVRQAYIVLIPLCVGLMFLHNAGDWVRKLVRLRSASPAPAQSAPGHIGVRMYRFERIQHACLVLSFFVLAWTGFLLKYPGASWTQPFALNGDTLRGTIHRAAAVVFIATALAHALSLLLNPTLRTHWKEMWPQFDDARQGLQAFLYNLGLTSARPSLSRYSYVEKIEYWAMVWGFVIMTASGVLLWANNAVLHWWPKEVLDVATALHFYEAVLACLAVAVWHLYMVIFDPDIYPMNPAWLTGHGASNLETAAPKPAAAHKVAVPKW